MCTWGVVAGIYEGSRIVRKGRRARPQDCCTRCWRYDPAGSIEDPNMLSKIAEILGCKADIVLSDVAPNVSGVWE